MFEAVILLSLFFLACLVIYSDNLRRAIIYLGFFSLLMAVTYLFYNAPDVALAEAAIGTGLSTVLYLIALKKVSVYNICYVNDEVEDFSDKHIFEVRKSILRPVEFFIEDQEEVEPQLSYTNEALHTVIEEGNHHCIIQHKDGSTYIYGKETDELFQDIISQLDTIFPDDLKIQIEYIDEVNTDEKTNENE